MGRAVVALAQHHQLPPLLPPQPAVAVGVVDGRRCGLCGRPIRAGEAHTDLVRAGNTAHVACAQAWQRERDAHQQAAAARAGASASPSWTPAPRALNGR